MYNVGSFIKTFVYFKCYLTTPSSLFDWLEISIELKPRKNWVREGGGSCLLLLTMGSLEGPTSLRGSP